MESGKGVRVREADKGGSHEKWPCEELRINQIENKKHFSSQDLQGVLVERAQVLRLKLNITRIKVRFNFTCTS